MDEPELRQILESLDPQEGGRPSGEELRTADIAQAMGGLDDEARQLVFSLLGDERASAVLTETDERTQESLLELLPPERVARLVDQMDPDDAADVLAVAPEDVRPAILALVDEETRRDVSLLGRYEPESAGGIMTTEVIAVGSNETVASALHKVREAEQPEAVGSIFVVDPAGTLVGLADIQRLLNARPEQTVAEVMAPDVISVRADADQEEAARLVDHYHLTSIPVVDQAGRLKGVITADDIIDVLGEEASEDMLRLAGTGVTHPTMEPVLRRLVARAPWLSVTLVGSFSAGLIIEYVEETWFGGSLPVDREFKSLLYFIPLIGGMAGNVGSQSSTIMVRGFATGEVDPTRPGRVLSGELVLAALIGLLAGPLVGLAASLAHPEMAWLGLVVGTALPCAIMMAALSGTLIPFACRWVKVDPAYASGPFLQTLNDIGAYVIYFAVALILMESLGLR